MNIYTDIFVWMLVNGIYLGQTINFGVYYGCFAQRDTFLQTIDEITSVSRTLYYTVMDNSNFAGGDLSDRLCALSDATRLELTTVDVYGKYGGGQTVKQSYALNKLGTRTSGLTGGLPPSSTIGISASASAYKRTGSSRGLWGVDESDQIDGNIATNSVVYGAASAVAACLNIDQEVDGNAEAYTFQTCAVKRIPYVTPKGKLASRLPLEPLDVPDCVLLGDWSVKTVVGNNKKRKLKSGGR